MYFLFFQLLKLFSRDGQAAPYFGFNPTSSLPCLRLKYQSTQRTTSPVIIFLFCSFSLLLIKISNCTCISLPYWNVFGRPFLILALWLKCGCLRIKRSWLEPWLWTLCCAPEQDTTLIVPLSTHRLEGGPRNGLASHPCRGRSTPSGFNCYWNQDKHRPYVPLGL